MQLGGFSLTVNRIIPVIMCGGSGTRLWPLSRDTLPKQFIPLLGERSTFQRTASYFSDRAVFDPPIAITNADYRFLVTEQLKDIGSDAEIVLEPMRRDSGPAVAVATEIAFARSPDAIVLVLAADHIISDPTAFIATCIEAGKVASSGRIVTIGVHPSYPATGYGYICPGEAIAGSHDARRISRFVEKPDAITAAQYLLDGYYWNSGNFIFHAATMRAELQRYEPDMLAAARQSLAFKRHDLNFTVLDADAFAKAPTKSIDYAVMEHTDKAVVIPARFGWSDVGGWNAVWDLSEKNEQGNAIEGRGEVIDGKNNYIRSHGMLTAIIGLDDVVVVTTEDAVLVAHRDKADGVKLLVNRLKSARIVEGSEHREIHRPWGKYHSVDVGDRHQVKRITVKPGGVLSLQKHHHRAEHWVVVKGTASVTRNSETIIVHENESVYLPIGCVHRMANPGKIDLEIIEVQVGSYLGEDDIQRIEDVYNRT